MKNNKLPILVLLVISSLLLFSAGRPNSKSVSTNSAAATDLIDVYISEVLGLQMLDPFYPAQLPKLDVGEVIFNAFNPTGNLWYLNIVYMPLGSTQTYWVGDNIPLYPFPDTLCSTIWIELDPEQVLPPEVIPEGVQLAFVCSDTVHTQKPDFGPSAFQFFPILPTIYSVGANEINPDAPVHAVPPDYDFPTLPPWEWEPPILPPLCKERGCNIPNLDLVGIENPPDLPGYAGDLNAASPAATANSMRWLMDQHPEILDALDDEFGDDAETLRELAEALSGLMQRDSLNILGQGEGVTPREMIIGKLLLVDSFDIPLKVKFQSASNDGSFMSPNPGSATIAINQNTASEVVDPMWIYQELCDGEDVEMIVQGILVDDAGNIYSGPQGPVRYSHTVTVTGMYKVGDRWGMTYKDDQNQFAEGGTTHAFTWLTPDNTFGKPDWVLDRFNKRLTVQEGPATYAITRPRYYIDYAVSESHDSMPPPTNEYCFEFGDAPEAAVAYPEPPSRVPGGVTGFYPTCIGAGPALFARHLIPIDEKFMLYLGPSVDYELDGNMGACGYPPYDRDECYSDPDAGLTMPRSFTILGGKIDTCPLGAGAPMRLGHACDLAVWGGTIDVVVNNLLPQQAYVNVLIDWTMNGAWGDVDVCMGVPVPEHVLVNYPVPPGFVGFLSALGPPFFQIGSTGGFAWMRVSISRSQEPIDWDGDDPYMDNGETEDFLIWIGAEDWGDAPEAALAYPPATFGSFPTCEFAGPASFIRHDNDFTCFGPSSDWERNGNAGLCPAGGSNADECYADGDAGLSLLGSYEIAGNLIVPCPNSVANTIGGSCDVVIWGADINITVDNYLPSCANAYVNVLADLNHDGDWNDFVNCNGVHQSEHVLINWAVPSLFSGPLSNLGPPPFSLGPDCGPIWMRFMVSEQQVGANWQGAGIFEFGETEDYLVVMDPDCEDPVYVEMGDAPEGEPAYADGTIGGFPTCFAPDPSDSSFIRHYGSLAYFGPDFDGEFDGNANLCPVFDPYDEDECFDDADAGLLFPDSYTLDTAGNVVLCPNSVHSSLGIPCTYAVWGRHIDIDVTNDYADVAYVNVLMDRNRNGQWGDTVDCGAEELSEHIVVNLPVPSGYSDSLSNLDPPKFFIGQDTGHVWFRFSITEKEVPTDWDGRGTFLLGETEDYLLHVDFCPNRLELHGTIYPGYYQADTIIADGVLDTGGLVSMMAASLVRFDDGFRTPDNSELRADNAPCSFPACCTMPPNMPIEMPGMEDGIPEDKSGSLLPLLEEGGMILMQDLQNHKIKLSSGSGQDGGRQVQVTIVNKAGKVVKLESFHSVRERMFDLSYLPTGLYILELRSGTGKWETKFVIDKQ